MSEVGVVTRVFVRLPVKASIDSLGHLLNTHFDTPHLVPDIHFAKRYCANISEKK